MRRIQLGKPYENFLDKMVESGYYATATEVIRDALRDKMAELENNRIATIHALIAEGEADITAGRVVPYTKGLMDSIYEKAMNQAGNGVEIPIHLRP